MLIVVTLTAAAAQRNLAWKTLLSVWSDCAAKSPAKSRVHNHLGNCYRLLKRPGPAIEEYRRALQLDPKNILAQYNLAVTLDRAGARAEAMAYYDSFCASAPPSLQALKETACDRLHELERYDLN